MTANNAEIGSIQQTKITGHYKPGYIYGKIKPHKIRSPNQTDYFIDLYSCISHIKNPQQYNITIYSEFIWKSDLTDKMKCSFFQAAVV